MGFQKGNTHSREYFKGSKGRPRKHGIHVYRCLYCREVFDAIHDLSKHEDTCPARQFKENEWENAIKRARRREVVNGYGSKAGGR